MASAGEQLSLAVFAIFFVGIQVPMNDYAAMPLDVFVSCFQ